MLIEIDVITTLLVAIVVLLIGRWLIGRIPPLQRYNIPEPVVGGMLAAIAITVAKVAADAELSFDMALQTPFMLAFFATVGLSADVRTLVRGGRGVILFLVAIATMLALQNAIGLAGALIMDLHPLNGLLAGSVTMLGGHGTGAAYATQFSDVDNLQGAMELAMACATFGLVLGGIIGGPVAQRLITRHGLTPGDGASTPSGQASADAVPAASRPLTVPLFLETLLLIMVCVVAGSALGELMKGKVLTLPPFVWTLFTGVVLRNVLGLARIREVDDGAVQLFGDVALSLFLTMALISLRLWELVSLALPILAILAVQTAFVATYTSLVTFRIMGRNYDAAVLAAGACGIGLGATPTAIANMQAVTHKYGPSPQAFLILPIVGAFLIDITNALIIQGYLNLPLFGF